MFKDKPAPHLHATGGGLHIVSVSATLQLLLHRHIECSGALMPH